MGRTKPLPNAVMTLGALLAPPLLISASAIYENTALLPDRAGVYAWYFDKAPPGVPLDGCHSYAGCTLLYVGISPSKPTSSLTRNQTLRGRISTHLKSNAEGSTLRLSLGVLLSDVLEIELRRVGNSGRRMTFGTGETGLTDWLREHAYLAWLEHEQPWELESAMLCRLSLPLNLSGNENHPFYEELKARRSAARARARELPILYSA